VPHVMAALAAQGIAPRAVSHVIVTHVHLDHAAGAGALLARLPAARLVVHPRGARHMIDPSKLLAGAAEVYGGMEAIRALYGDVLPAPADRVIEAPEGTVVDLGGRSLRMLDAPGHARHHFVVHDPATRGFFTGDTFGISYREFDDAGRPFMYPTTTPVQFDPPALRASVERMLAERPERMYLTHYGMIEGRIPEAAAAMLEAVDGHVAVARAAPPGPGRQAAIRAGLAEQLLGLLSQRGWSGTREEALEAYATDLDLNSQGLEVWLGSLAKG
jgi:glyoxylase-like metal-dependent hydrolase (beta-lactamase superfamily II)